MNLIYPINFIGYEKWCENNYSTDFANGDVITREGEIIGTWQALDYNLNDTNPIGKYEFIEIDSDTIKFTGSTGLLYSGISSGMALSEITRTIKEWYESEHGRIL